MTTKDYIMCQPGQPCNNELTQDIKNIDAKLLDMVSVIVNMQKEALNRGNETYPFVLLIQFSDAEMSMATNTPVGSGEAEDMLLQAALMRFNPIKESVAY